nr:tetratricopeptide repeat protein [Deinococcota bacterium]
VQIETREVPRVDTRRHYPVSERPLKLPYSLSQIQFGGRDREFSFLAARLQAAMKNMGGAVIIEGEAGVGKTRLVEEFLDHARSHGARVLAGRCFERELDPPLEPLLTALDPLLAKEPLLPKALRRDGQELAYLPGGKPYDSSHVYQTLTGSVLREARREKALVLFVDDLQWADPATLEFLAYVAKRVQSEPVLLVVTYRREDVADLAPWLDHLAERRACTRLSLGRLMPQETAELLKGMTSEDFSELALLAGFLHEESEGNPFYAVEYLRWLLEAGVVETDTQGHIQALNSERLQQAVVPSGVHSLIQARLRSLDGEAKALLNLAAVIGRTFELELICRAVNREEAEAFGILKPLIDKGLITETPGEVYGFSHDKLRHALYEGIGSPQRRALHLKVAGVLAEAGAEPAELAHHYLRARVWQEALENLERAARKAEEAYAWDSALQIYVRALEVATKLPDCEAERFELLGAQERLLERLHHREERAKAVAEMFALAKRLGDRARLAEVQIRRIGILPPEAAVQAGQEAARLFRERGDEAGEARAHRELAYVLWTGGNYAGSLEANFRSLDIHRKLGDLQGEAGDVGNIAQVYLSLGNLDEALSWAEEAVRMYQELGDKVGEALRKFVVADVHRERGDLEAALRLTLQVLHLETELGVKHFVVAQHNYGGTLQLALGVPEQALESFRAAAQLSREIGSTKEEGNAWIGVGISLEKLGNFAGAAAAYRQAVELLEAAYKVSGHAEELSAKAAALSALAKLLHHALDQPQEALDSYQAATEIIRELGDDARLRKLLLGLAGLSWRMGRLEDSARGYEEALGLARAHEDTVHEAAALASLGVVYRDLGRLKNSVVCGRKALSLLQDLKDLQAEAYVLSSLAESYQRIGQSSSALTCLRRSLRLRREIGDKEGEVGVLNDLSKIYESLGDEGRAQSFSKKATWKSQALSVCSAERIG